MSTLVTGGTGAIGAMVCRHLVERGDNVVAYDWAVDYTLLDDLRDKMAFERGDVLDLPHLLRTMQKLNVDKVVHLAVILPPQEKNQPSYAFQINTVGTLNVIEACLAVNAKRLVFTSSKGAFGVITPPHAPPTYEPVTEDYPRRPVMIYDISKAACEDLCVYYQRNFGLNYITLRFPTLYGPGRISRHGDLAIVSKLIEGARAGEPVRVAAQPEWTDELLYTGDVARAVALALDAGTPEHRSFLIGTGKLTTLAQLLEEVHEIYPSANIEILPGEVRENRACRFDISRATSELGWKPQYQLPEGLREYVRVLASR